MVSKIQILCCAVALFATSGFSAASWADDAQDLKAQLEALENQVEALSERQEQKKPASSAGPIIIQRGQGSLAKWNTDRKQEGEMPSDRGYTITTNPASDAGFPKTEVTISGAVGGSLIVDGK